MPCNSLDTGGIWQQYEPIGNLSAQYGPIVSNSWALSVLAHINNYAMLHLARPMHYPKQDGKEGRASKESKEEKVGTVGA
jgi:hypothetical protein